MRIADVAAELGTNTTYLSACLNGELVSGFTNEKTFLRAFKAVCGVTPSEWKQELPLQP